MSNHSEAEGEQDEIERAKAFAKTLRADTGNAGISSKKI